MPPPAAIRTTSHGPPVLIEKEGSTRTRGDDIRRNTIQAAKLLADMIKTSIGPRGMDKMFIDKIDEIVITNETSLMLQKMKVDHPSARILVEVAEATHAEVGDGTASTVLLTSALLSKGEELISDGMHPNAIIAGYSRALRRSLEILDDIAVSVSSMDNAVLTDIAHTSVRTKLFTSEADHLAELAVAASTQIAEKRGDEGYKVIHDTIKIEKRPGGSIQDSLLIKGVILDKQVFFNTIKRVENAKIAVLCDRLYIEKPKFVREQFAQVVNITDPAQIKSFKEVRDSILKGWVEKLVSSGANVVINEKGTDPVVTYYLDQAGIIALNRTIRFDIDYVAKATGARIVNDFRQFSAADLGEAALVEERKIDSRRLFFIEGCKNPKAVTIFLRGATKETADEAARVTNDALMVVKDVIENPAIVAGGGACETEVASRIRSWSEKSIETREQLAAEKFAEALEILSMTLAKNSGMDMIDTMTELRAKHATGGLWYGIDAKSRKVKDTYKEGIIEPLVVKKQMLKAATEAACMILRVDLAFAVKRLK